MNTFLTIGMVTRETLIVLENELAFTRCVTREYNDQFAKTGAKIGNTLNVRKPVRFVNSNGQGLVLQDLVETTVPLILNKQYQRSFAVTSSDLALNIDDFSKRFVRPPIISMANEIDFDGLSQYINIANSVGTPGTPFTTSAVPLAAGALLSKEAAPEDGRDFVIGPDQNAAIVQGLSGLFNPQVTQSKQFRKGMMSEDTLGGSWFKDQNINTQVTGLLGGTPTVNATAGQTGSSIVTTGWTSAVAIRLKRGDVFTLAGVFGVNPQNRTSYGTLRYFTVASDFSSDGSGNGTINFSPAIVTTGPFQNVTAAPAALAAITPYASTATVSSPQSLMFHPDAFTFATADLPLYGGLDMAERKQLNGNSMRVIRDYDINLDRAPLRIDLLGGWATLYQELAVRMWG